MITGIGIQNFRVFDEMTQIDFAPITVLTGRNNSGKSSVLKALLLLQDNAKKNNLTELDFNSSTHQLGTFKEALSKNKKRNKSDEMVFYVKTDIKGAVPKFLFFGSENVTLEKTYKLDNKKKKGNLLHITLKDSKDFLYFNTEMQSLFFNLDNCISINSKRILKNIAERLKKNKALLPYLLPLYSDNLFLLDVQKYASSINSSKELLNESRLKELLGEYDENFAKLLNDRLLKLFSIFFNIHLYPLEYINLYNDLFFHFHFNQSFSFETLQKNLLNTSHTEKIDETIEKKYLISLKNELFTKEEREKYKTEIEKLVFNDELLDSEMVIIIQKIGKLLHNYIKKHINSLENLTFLTVARSNVQRIYLNNNQGTVFNELIYEFLKRDFSKNGTEYHFLNTALKDIFQIGEGIVFEEIAGIGTIIKIQKDGELYNLADMGFGLTALLPILLKIVLSPETLLMIEEPESNLHPNFQAKLADLFVLAKKMFDIRFILETHSEYLIRRLQILTALKEHEYHLETDETALYYFYPPDEVPRGKEQVSRIHILEDGRLDGEFGEGFWEMSTTQQIDLMKIKNQNKPKKVWK